MNRPPRMPASLPQSLNQRLNTYALAAAAAGVGALALVPSAEAKIVYTPAHKRLPINKDFLLDLNHDRIDDFKFHLGSQYHAAHTFTNTLPVFPVAHGNAIWSHLSGTSEGHMLCAAALPKGAKVGQGDPFFSDGFVDMGFVLYSFTNKRKYCPWLKVQTQPYLGLKFLVQGEVHYGWARFADVHLLTNPVSATLTGYAYETVPNKPIVTGAIVGDSEEVSDPRGVGAVNREPVTLGVLAQGSSGLCVWRREESLAAQ